MPDKPTVFFHIGGHKTGTTYLQKILWRNRARLRSAGLLFPGTHPAAHIWANFDLRESDFHSYRAPEVDGAWTRLVDEIRAWGGPAIIDQEMFSRAEPAHIERALGDLDFADVRILFTARDLARQLPAVWQEWVKNRSTLSFADFLAEVAQDGSSYAHRFWGWHDVPAILAGWSRPLGADRIRLITVPRPGTDCVVLWQRFAGVLGIDPDGYDVTVADANASLGAVEAAVLRRLNLALPDGDRMPWPEYQRLVKTGLAPVLVGRRGERIALPPDAFEWALGHARRQVAALRAAGYAVTGDLEELLPTACPAGVDPDRVDARVLAETAVAAVAIALRQQRSRERRRAQAPAAAVAAG